MGFQDHNCITVSINAQGREARERVPLQVGSKITGGEVRGHKEAWTWTTHPDFKSTKEQSPVTPVPLTLVSLNSRLMPRGSQLSHGDRKVPKVTQLIGVSPVQKRRP